MRLNIGHIIYAKAVIKISYWMVSKIQMRDVHFAPLKNFMSLSQQRKGIKRSDNQ